MDPLDAALDLMRRLPPQHITTHLPALLDILPADVGEDVLASVDQPLRVQQAQGKQAPPPTGRVRPSAYLLCDYNRDGDSYRNPFSNEYHPPLPDGGARPSPLLRELELQLNDAFQVYKDLYYDGTDSGGRAWANAYCWDLPEGDGGGFACAVLFKKQLATGGGWDAVHVVACHPSPAGKMAVYKLTSTVIVSLLAAAAAGAGSGATTKMDLSGQLTRQIEAAVPYAVAANANQSHLQAIGALVEDMESKLRTTIQDVYFGKTKDVVNALRAVVPRGERKKAEEVQRELAGKLSGH